MSIFKSLPIIISITLFLMAQVLVTKTTFASEPEIICFDDFEGGMPDKRKINYGSLSSGSVAISSDRSENYNNSAGSIRGQYPANASGGNYIWANCKFSELNINDIYIEFKAKMPADVYGFKFLKIFGQQDSGYANTTFGLSYNTGEMTQVSFGDGSTAYNDTAQVINLDGSNPELISRSYGTATLSTPQNSVWTAQDWGTEWHHFKFHLKFNSGTTSANEIADGEYYVEIDGVVYVDTDGLFNRHYSNQPIEKVSIFGWTQITGNSPFEVWYDDFIVTTGGFIGMQPVSPTLQPPNSFKLLIQN